MATHAPAAQLRHVTPYLCAHDARAAIAWYTEYFGARLNGDPLSMDGAPFDDTSRVGHCELWFGDSVVYLSDEWPEGGVLSPRTLGGTASSFVLDVPTVADVDAIFDRAVAHGATALRPPSDQFYGARAGQLSDPFGYRWSISSATAPLDDLTDDLSDVPTIAATRGGEGEPFLATELWNEVGYYTIAVPDPARARAFYNGLFGWDLPEPDRTNAGYLGMHNHSTKIPMGVINETAGERATRLFFRVHDLDAAVARVLELGGTVVSADRYDSGGNAVVRDDQGYEFDLWQPAEGY